MNVKVADTWVTVPEISLEREDEGMKIEVGEAFKVLENKLPVFHENAIFVVTDVIPDIDSQGERTATIRFWFATGPNQGEKCEFDYELLQELKMIRVYDEKYSKEQEDIIKLGKPAHYDSAIDTIAFAKANFPPEQVEGFFRINVVKYVQRYNKKNGADDIRKAIVYLNELLKHVEGEGK